MGKQWQTLFWGAPKSLQMVTATMKLKDAYSLEGNYDKPRQHIKKQRHYFANKGPSSQGYGLSSSHVRMWELDYKENWVLKNWCFELWYWRRLLRESLGLQGDPTSPSQRKSVLNIHWKGWCWSWNSNSLPNWCKELTHWKRPNAGKDWRQEEKGMTGWDGWMVPPTQ